MRRRLLNLLTLLSLLLCVAVVALWVRRYWVSAHVSGESVFDQPPGVRHLGEWGAHTGAGGASFWFASFAWDTVPADGSMEVTDGARWRWEGREPRAPRGDSTSPWDRYGFGFERHNPPTLVYFPLWLPAVLFGLPPALWLRQRLKRGRRAIAWRCCHCGYDLRATPGRCPECGMPAAAAGAQA